MEALPYHLLQTALAVANAGSPSRAAKLLGISVTTVYRHLESLEGSLGVQLFDRQYNGWAIRDAALALIHTGKEVEHLLQRARTEIKEAAGIGSDILRIAVSEDIAIHYVIPLLTEFRQIKTGLRVELIVSSEFSDLTNGEADVAIRPDANPGDILVGSRVGEINHAFYASHAYISRHGEFHTIADQSKHLFCGYGAVLKGYSAARWMEANIDPNVQIVRIDDTNAILQAVTEDIGIGLLPCFMADRIPSLKVVMPIDNRLPVDIWLITASKNRNRPNIRAFFQFFAPAFRKDKGLFAGQPYQR